jgi:hypothetical protein
LSGRMRRVQDDDHPEQEAEAGPFESHDGTPAHGWYVSTEYYSSTTRTVTALWRKSHAAFRISTLVLTRRWGA